MNYFSIILGTIFGLLGYLYSFIINWHKLKQKKLLILLLLVTAIIFVVIQIDQKRTQNSRDAEYRSRHDSLSVQNDTLKSEVKRLSVQLEPVIKLANENFPGLGDDLAIKQLLSKISRMESKIEYLRSETNIDPIHGYYVTEFYFGSQYPVAVRDINIKLEFDRSLLSAKHYFKGAFVVEQDSNLELVAGNKIEFTTGLLAVGNDIVIQTSSRESLSIIDMKFQSR
jgi:hypothetical protein